MMHDEEKPPHAGRLGQFGQTHGELMNYFLGPILAKIANRIIAEGGQVNDCVEASRSSADKSPRAFAETPRVVPNDLVPCLQEHRQHHRADVSIVPGH